MAAGQTTRPGLRSLTYRDGDRVLPTSAAPPIAARLAKGLCPEGHLRPTRFGSCPRCGTRLQSEVH